MTREQFHQVRFATEDDIQMIADSSRRAEISEITRALAEFRNGAAQLKPERIEEQVGDIPVPPFVIPRELFTEHFDERIVDFPVPPTVREAPDVTSAPDAVHAASAPVVESLAPVIECGSSSSSAAHAAPTSTDGIFEQLEHVRTH